MTSVLRRFLLISSAVAMIAPPAVAWTRPGHMVAAAIAYDELMATDPGIVREILRLIAAHPDRGPFEVAVGRSVGAERDRSLFVEIARWPDDIRGGAQDHPTWHYQMHPVIDPVAPPAKAPDPRPRGAAAEAFALNTKVAGDALAADSERAVALCWVFHIAADIHQPLHTAQRFGAAWPDGDAGGSRAFVNDPITGEALSLHWFWDDSVNRQSDTAAVFEKAQQLTARFPRAHFAAQLKDSQLKESMPGNFNAWAAESLRLASATAYRADAPRALTAQTSQAAGEAYRRDAAAAAAERLTLSAYRLTNLLRAMFAKPG